MTDTTDISVEEAGKDPKIAVSADYIRKNLISPILERRRKTGNLNSEVKFKYFDFRVHILEEHEKAHMHWHRSTEGGMRGITAFKRLATPLSKQCHLHEEKRTRTVPFPKTHVSRPYTTNTNTFFTTYETLLEILCEWKLY